MQAACVAGGVTFCVGLRLSTAWWLRLACSIRTWCLLVNGSARTPPLCPFAVIQASLSLSFSNVHSPHQHAHSQSHQNRPSPGPCICACPRFESQALIAGLPPPRATRSVAGPRVPASQLAGRCPSWQRDIPVVPYEQCLVCLVAVVCLRVASRYGITLYSLASAVRRSDDDLANLWCACFSCYGTRVGDPVP